MYEDSPVLKNKLNIRTQDELDDAEAYNKEHLFMIIGMKVFFFADTICKRGDFHGSST